MGLLDMAKIIIQFEDAELERSGGIADVLIGAKIKIEKDPGKTHSNMVAEKIALVYEENLSLAVEAAVKSHNNQFHND